MKFTGELHNVKLINFSVNLEEVLPFVPNQLKILQENGKAIISMVDVQLKNMSPKILPFIKFSYRHMAFRLLIDDSGMNSEHEPKGVFFLKSFSENSILNKLGNIMADYQLSKVKVEEYFDAFSLKQDKKYVDYALDPYTNLEESEELYQKIHRIDRAYATKDEDIFVTEIARKNWPITPIKCYHFATNFFKSAKLLGAFKVDGVIDYTWQDAKQIV
ncbi:DUF2071 domain-containing protein [Flavobacteriales bacterium]|jgi:hypothetical protein|nr:DUF2071 domain-containing protein [Flavobacteriales bacterium]